MENQSKVIMIERNKFASLVKAHRKCLQMLSILAYACATKEVQLTFTLEEICELLQMSREEVERQRQKGYIRFVHRNGMTVYEIMTMDAATGKSSAALLISSDPEKGFTQIADSDSLFNYPAYRYSDSIYGGSIWDMVEYNNSLYVSICTGTEDNMPNNNTMQSFALVRGDQNADGTFTWTPVPGTPLASTRSAPVPVQPT